MMMDAATGKVLHTIDFTDSSYDHKGLAATPDERFLFVTNYDRRDITQVDLRTIGGNPTC